MIAAPPNPGRVAYRAFQRIADAWKLTREQRIALLGISESTALRWRENPRPDRTQLERISYVLGIYSGLAAIFENAPLATEWVHRPNLNFGDRPPLDRMLAGNVGDLAFVRNYVDTWRSGP